MLIYRGNNIFVILRNIVNKYGKNIPLWSICVSLLLSLLLPSCLSTLLLFYEVMIVLYTLYWYVFLFIFNFIHSEEIWAGPIHFSYSCYYKIMQKKKESYYPEMAPNSRNDPLIIWQKHMLWHYSLGKQNRKQQSIIIKTTSPDFISFNAHFDMILI